MLYIDYARENCLLLFVAFRIAEHQEWESKIKFSYCLKLKKNDSYYLYAI